MSETPHSQHYPAPYPYGISETELLFLGRLSTQMIGSRLEAGHHPEDILCSVLDLYEHTTRSLLDGIYVGGNQEFCRREELDDAQVRIVELLSELDDRDRYIKQLEAACAPSKLEKIRKEQ